VPIVLKAGSLNRLELSGSVQACNGIALPLPRRWNVNPLVQPQREAILHVILMLTHSRNIHVSRVKITVPSVAITVGYKDQNGCHSFWVCSQYPTRAEEEQLSISL
jgi:hypothetical protein